MKVLIIATISLCYITLSFGYGVLPQCQGKTTAPIENCECWKNKIDTLLNGQLLTLQGITSCTKDYGDEDKVKNHFKNLLEKMDKLVNDYKKEKESREICLCLTDIKDRIGHLKNSAEELAKNINTNPDNKQCIDKKAQDIKTYVEDNLKGC